jgi:hypothetical protein
MSNENEFVQQFERKCRKIVSDAFKPHDEYIKKCLEWIDKSIEASEELKKMFDYRLADIVTISDLRAIGSILALTAYSQWHVMNFSRKITEDMKDIAYYLIDAPLTLLIKCLPEVGEVTKELIEDKLKDVKGKIEQLEQKREIELTVHEDIKKALEEWVREREEAKKAYQKYIE